MRKVTFLVSLALLCCMVASCGSGSKASSTTPVSQTTPVSTDPASDPDPKPNGSITISGTVTFDRVGHLSNGGLDYSNIEQKPIRAVIVQLLHSDGSVVGQTMTDDSGRFDISASPNISVKIRVLAQLLKVGTPSWNFMVTDNTRGNALYALDGDLFNSGSEDMTRDLHASSGWGGNDYVGPRAAAPFAILDSIYSAVQLLLSADANVVIPSSEIRWSENNKPVSGDWDRGQIGTSFYEPRDRALYILGDKNNDTDEYDESVIQHEFAHFFEDSLSRTDSIGGAHSITSRLDPRVAFSEGLANAFAGMLSETASYSDSSGSKQASGFIFKLEESTVGSEGW